MTESEQRENRLRSRFGRVERPHPNLLTYYALASLVLGPFFFLLLLPRAVRYRTLQYVFDDHGVTMRWGMLIRREVHVAYTRIQDIHLSSGVLERWLGLARVQVQTASGSAEAELTLEGFQDYEEVRDLLYAQMRDAKGETSGRRTSSAARRPTETAPGLAEALASAAEDLRRVRQLLEAERRPGPEDPRS
jgi:putative membrane protein